MEGQKGPAIARVQEKIPFFRNKLPELISLADRRNLITPSLETSQTENPSKVSADPLKHRASPILLRISPPLMKEISFTFTFFLSKNLYWEER